MYCIVYGVTKSQTWLSDFKKKNVGLGWEFDDLSERHCSLEQAITHLNTLIFKFADSFFFFFFLFKYADLLQRDFHLELYLSAS